MHREETVPTELCVMHRAEKGSAREGYKQYGEKCMETVGRYLAEMDVAFER